jgi:hypothetical protein
MIKITLLCFYKSIFKIHQNNIYIYIYIIFNINTLKLSKTPKITNLIIFKINNILK